MDASWWVVAVVGVAGVWWAVCVDRAYCQRGRLIWNRSFSDDEFWAQSREWKAVSFEAHCWALFCFRDPKRLYGPLTQKIWADAEDLVGKGL